MLEDKERIKGSSALNEQTLYYQILYIQTMALNNMVTAFSVH